MASQQLSFIWRWLSTAAFISFVLMIESVYGESCPNRDFYDWEGNLFSVSSTEECTSSLWGVCLVSKCEPDEAIYQSAIDSAGWINSDCFEYKAGSEGSDDMQCSIPHEDPEFSELFDPACKTHDLCLKTDGRNGDACNDEFYYNMKEICKLQYPDFETAAALGTCLIAASAWDDAVNLFAEHRGGIDPDTCGYFGSIADVGMNPTVTLGMCQGDCDTDAHCEAGLVCLQRDGAAGLVAGCVGNPTYLWDYCVQPSIADVGVDPTVTLGLCQGDCDTDANCEAGLSCFQRDDDAGSVPGCVGSPFTNWDYCVQPRITDVGNLDFQFWSWTLGLCQGDCDTDANCEAGLVCLQRDGAAGPVAGCSGNPTDNWDYCVSSSLSGNMYNWVFLELSFTVQCAILVIGILSVVNLVMLTYSVYQRCQRDRTRVYSKVKMVDSESEYA